MSIAFGWKDQIGLVDALGIQISPATEQKQDDIISALGGLTPATAYDNTATVTNAGTRVQLPSVAIKRVIIQAHESNIGTITFGGTTVVAALVGRRGIALSPTFVSGWLYVSNLDKIWIDSTVSGDKISYYYET